MKSPGPTCYHPHVLVDDWDHGRDPETGYQDSGTRVTCRDCGEVFEPQEWDQELAAIAKLAPQPGELFYQCGARIRIIAVEEQTIYYVCNPGLHPGPCRPVSVGRFLTDLSAGILQRPPFHEVTP